MTPMYVCVNTQYIKILNAEYKEHRYFSNEV
jgi:hypothetical protein